MILKFEYERKNNNEIVLKAAGKEGKERKEKDCERKCRRKDQERRRG